MVKHVVHMQVHGRPWEVGAVTEAAVEWPNDLACDAVLIRAVRGGDVAAYGVLYERHVAAARRAAAGLAASRAEREDLVAEAFTRVLRVLREGHGPVEGFRPYLLTTMRNAVISSARRGPAVSLFAEVPDPRGPGGPEDPMSSRVHSVVVADAFASLPERWRVVLWHTEIEGETPSSIAAMLGMTANGVAALAYRAREGLRQAYLQQHLPALEREDCRAVAEQLAGWVRRGFPARKMRRITAHLDGCDRCRELADGLGELNGELRGVLTPIVLGAPFAVAYLSTSASSGTALATSAGAGVSTISWLTAAKTVVAGTAIVTTAAVGPAASDPDPAPLPHGDMVAVSGPAQPQPPAPRAVPPDATSPHAPAPRSDAATGAVTPTDVTEERKATKQAKEDKKAVKEADKQAKAEAEAAKKEAKKEPKEPKKPK